MTYSIKKLFHINAPRERVFEAISTIKGLSNWWTINTSGDSSKNKIIRFTFGEMEGPQMKVVEITPNERIKWECVAGSDGWIGHTFTFFLDENDGKTRVRFSHELWPEDDDFYAACCFSWGRYMESLRQYCQTGKGEAFGSEGYRR
ncbi:MAG: SRPBCC family protein [Chitinophagales bacterium]